MSTLTPFPDSRARRHPLLRHPRIPRWMSRPFRPSLPPAPEPWVSGRISVHDRQQIELTWTYPSAIHRDAHYRVDVFFFLPNAIGISAETYDPAAFFRDTQTYIRLATPKVPLHRLLDLQAPSPLADLAAALRPPSLPSNAILQAKLAGTVLRTAIRRQRRKLLQLATSPDAEPARVVKACEQFCTNLSALLTRYRALRAVDCPEKADTALGLIDDTLSGIVLEATCDIIHALEERSDSLAQAVELLSAFLDKEVTYRNEHKWLTLRTSCTPLELESLMYRRSQLKKYLFSALFLRVRRLRSQTLVQHLFSSIGACLAATFAFFSNPALFGSVTINSLTFAILFVAVFAYILKDRMKEVTRQYLAGRFRKWLPDRDRQVFPTDLSPTPSKPIGRVKEYISFVPSSKVDPDIHRIRNIVHTIDLGEEASESILHYAKVIQIKPGVSAPCAREGIKDILRFNVGHFLTRLDESLDTIYAFDPETRRASQIEGGHVYHVNVVMRHVAYGPDGTPSTPTLERIRLVLQKSGILRIEPVLLDSAQELADEDHAAEEGEDPMEQGL